ncbi:MAG: thermonuclease family protein [Bdellovibrionales bacterium]
MRQILIVLFLITSAFSSSYAQDTESLPSIDFQNMKRIGQERVQDVVSPVELLMEDGSIIRLVGIDIPTLNYDNPSALAVTARDIMRDLLSGQRVEVYQTRDRNVGLINRMEHRLAHVKLVKDEIWAQGVLLKLGLARVKTTPYNDHMVPEMLVLEEKAREELLGIWEDDAYQVYDAQNAEGTIGQYAVVQGRVESVALKKNRIYINFGKNWKSDFTVSIAPEDKRAFSKAKLDPLNWGGQILRARGNIRDYNGPYMEISHPAAIEIIKE